MSESGAGGSAGFAGPGWAELVAAAEAAGRWAACRLAERCTLATLARPGPAWVCVEPSDSPAACWLLAHEPRAAAASRNAVWVRVDLDAADLGTAVDAERKVRSLLVGRAYAGAYSTVLAEEAGVAATPVIRPALPAVVRCAVPAHASVSARGPAAMPVAPAS